MLETRCSDAGGASTAAYKGDRNRQGLYRESEGFIVPFEGKDNITFPEGRDPALLMQPKSGGYGDCRDAINPFKYQDTTEEAVS